MSFRKRFQFWLDFGKAEHIQLAEIIADLKSKRLYASTIRDGIRLINSLRQGDVSVLLELFPDVREKLKQKDPDPGTGDNGKLASALEQLALAVQAGVLQAPAGGTVHHHKPATAQPLPGAIGPGKHSSKVASGPGSYDDDLSAVAVKQSDSSKPDNSANNFLNSLMALQG